MKVELVKNTISNEEIDKLRNWLGTYPRLTQGELVLEFEKKFAAWNGSKFAVMVNSGSSANLAVIQSLLYRKEPLRNKVVLVPSLAWHTSISPFIQLGFFPKLVDIDTQTFGIDLKHLEEQINKYKPSILLLVHVLGIPCKIKEIKELCLKNDVEIIEDSCESLGSEVDKQKVGTFGSFGTFSSFYGHHFSTIEGGMIVCDDEYNYEILKMVRSHGFTRNSKPEFRKHLQEQYDISDFDMLYTFFLCGYNLRSTDLNAFIGLEQLKKFDELCIERNKNFNLYNKLVKNNDWKYELDERYFVSSFAYPVITKNRPKLIENLKKNEVECRPIISGSMGKQVFWKELYGEKILPNVDVIDKNGLYVPNYHGLKEEEIEFVSNIINESI